MTDKFTPSQKKLLVEIAKGMELVRDGGAYWLRDPKIKTGQMMVKVGSVTVDKLITLRVIERVGRHPERGYMELFRVRPQ